MNAITRRDFTKMMGVVGAAALLPTARVWGANESIRMAAIGLGGKGSQNARVFREMPGIRLVAACDADRKHLDKNLEGYSQKPDFGMPEGYTDFRRILDRQGNRERRSGIFTDHTALGGIHPRVPAERRSV